MSALPDRASAARDLAGAWLAHLERDPRHLPIPWINQWGAETVAATRISWDRHIGRPALFHDDHGDVADFTRQNIGRQRQAVVEGLCQVCGRFTPWSRRNLVVSSASVSWVPHGRREVPAVAEPWLDDRCAAIAVLLCPALIRRRHDEDLHVITVRRRRDIDIIVSVGTLDADKLADAQAAHPDHVLRLRAALARGPVGMRARIVLRTHNITRRRADTGADTDADTGAAGGGYATVTPAD